MNANKESYESETTERRRSGVPHFVEGARNRASLASGEYVAVNNSQKIDHSETLEQNILRLLAGPVGEIMARSVLIHCTKTCNVTLGKMRSGDAERLLVQLEKGLRLYVESQNNRKACVEAIAGLLKARIVVAVNVQEKVIPIKVEMDIVTARNVGRDICKALGFSVTGQTRVATAISELARNIVQYTPGGTVTVSTIEGLRPGIAIVARDTGSGIDNLDEILAGNYVSRTGMGKGLAGTRQLMDSFVVQTTPTGTEITARKFVNSNDARRC